MSLRIAPCSFEAAKYAVENWHYSRALPSGKLVKFGVWENEKFIGAILYGRGATPQLGAPYKLDQTEICELVRVALTKHEAPVSQIVAQTLHELKKTNPGLRLVISFADPDEGHHGGIYQAGNWIYSGETPPAKFYRIHGKVVHPRTAYSMGKNSLNWLIANIDPKATAVFKPGKHRYLFPLDKSMRRKIGVLRLPYPNAAEDSMVSRNNSVVEGQVRLLPAALRGN